MTCSIEPAGSAALRAARARLGETTIDHAYFKEARRGLQEKLDTHNLGPAGWSVRCRERQARSQGGGAPQQTDP